MDYDKYPGILIHSNLSWKQHILFISSKISKSQLWNSFKIETLCSHWYFKFTKHISVFIQPYMMYGSAVWG